MQTSISATGSIQPAVAWERYAELERWPGWAPQITRVQAPAPRLVAGLRGRVRAAGVLGVPFEVLAVDETARTWSWKVRLGLLTLHLDHGIDAADHGSRAWLRIRGPAVVVLPYTPLAFVALHFLVQDR